MAEISALTSNSTHTMYSCFSNFLNTNLTSPFVQCRFRVHTFRDPTVRPWMRRRKSLNLPPLATPTSHELHLVSSREHHDGSVIFQFGDPSEIEKNVELLEDAKIESTEGGKEMDAFDIVQINNVSNNNVDSFGVDMVNGVDERLAGRNTALENVVEFGEVSNGEEKSDGILNQMPVSVLDKKLCIEDGEAFEKDLADDGENDIRIQTATENLSSSTTMQFSDIETMEAEDQNFKDVIIPSASVNLELGIVNHGSDNEVTDAKEKKLEDKMFESVSVVEPTISIQASNIEDLDAEDQNAEEIMLPSVKIDPSMSTNTEVLNENVDESVLQPVSVNLEPSLTTQNVDALDTEDQNVDGGMQLLNHEGSAETDVEEAMPLSNPLESEPILDEEVTSNILEDYTESDGIGSPITLNQGVLNSSLVADRAEGTPKETELSKVSVVEVTNVGEMETIEKREEVSSTGFILSSGAASLAHPSKALTGVENAYFVTCSSWIGLADGSTRWSLEGIDQGVYARELISNCEKIVSEHRSVPIINPVELLCRSASQTHSPGSATVLVAHFDGQTLHVANIGDTGFLVIRHGAVYKKSFPMLHEFSFALQIESGDDPLQFVEQYKIDLVEGDAIVFATDGLFDNLYEQEIVRVVSKSLEAALEPQEIAEVLATGSQEAGRSTTLRSPFADAARAAGYIEYTGGKLDGVAVIVSLLKNQNNPGVS